ncbi:hypothetical protein CRE_11140 [Caenorhabditis remanei]|uniref:Acyl_transf_3 domain-containing protein n=1 Tax=Caenorhabditis remanei TaxID=31234 RepID=E3M5T9_CAERE|nr:hypothetical protein CRE_11140 [Caenorhabditis remanei]
MNQPKPSKRLDLQGIRACAIIVVLGFHFFPNYCPNGYLGVDQFFVLSGFLMCMLLKRAESLPAHSLITTFYTRRFKRILPLYLLVLFVSLIFLYLVFPSSAIETNQESAKYALLFVSNRAKSDQENYFQMLSVAIDIFTHTWSLAVEIQFYFLVPFIFLLATKIPIKYHYGYYGVLGMMVYLYGYSISQNSSKNRKYCFLMCEEGGVKDNANVQFILENRGENDEIHGEEEEGNVRKQNKKGVVSSYILLGSLFLITALPWTLSSKIVRPIVTIGTGLLILCSEGNLVLSSKGLTYIGDISYSLYLIHWPIYAYWKLTSGGTLLLFVALLSSIGLAIVTFEFFEKWYLKLSSKNVGALVMILFFANVIAIYKDDISDTIQYMGRDYSNVNHVTENMTVGKPYFLIDKNLLRIFLDDAIHLNYLWSKNDLNNLYAPSCIYESVNTPYGWCRHSGLSKNGKYKIVTFGNSWTANHAKIFYEECGYKAKSILQGAAYGREPGSRLSIKHVEISACEPLYISGNYASDVCKSNFTTFETRIEQEKPDYAFHFTRHVEIGAPFPDNVTTFDKDPVYQIMKGQMLKFIANIKFKLFIMHAIPTIVVDSIGKVARMVKNGIDLINIDNFLVHPDQYEMARKRYEQLMKDCNGKCEMVDYLPEFYNNSTKTFRYFDEKGFLYFTTNRHLSPHGLEKIRHVWTDICSKL